LNVPWKFLESSLKVPWMFPERHRTIQSGGSEAISTNPATVSTEGEGTHSGLLSVLTFQSQLFSLMLSFRGSTLSHTV
jgi:hypothetical protein